MGRRVIAPCEGEDGVETAEAVEWRDGGFEEASDVPSLPSGDGDDLTLVESRINREVGCDGPDFFGHGAQVQALGGSSATDVWGAGTAGLLTHWDGIGWELAKSPTKKDLNAVWSQTADNVWAVGNGGTILHWNGARWDLTTPNVRFDLRGVWGSSVTDVWAVGGLSPGFVLHYDGHDWRSLPSPGFAPEGIWGLGPKAIWTYGSEGKLARWSVDHWETTSTAVKGAIRAIWASDENNIWTVQQSVGRPSNAQHWDGTQWRAVKLGHGETLVAIVGDRRGVMWTSGANQSLFRRDGTRWRPSLGTYDSHKNWYTVIRALWTDGAGGLWAAGTPKIYGAVLLGRGSETCANGP